MRLNDVAMRIRRMKQEDIEEVCEIEKSIFSMPWKKKDFLDSIQKQTNLYLIAEVEGNIVGYCGLWGIVGEGQINNVAIRREYRGCGIASEMLKQLLEKAREMGLEEFTLEVRESNQSAICLYQKLGFQKEGIRENFYQNPIENAIIMWIRRNYH